MKKTSFEKRVKIFCVTTVMWHIYTETVRVSYFVNYCSGDVVNKKCSINNWWKLENPINCWSLLMFLGAGHLLTVFTLICSIRTLLLEIIKSQYPTLDLENLHFPGFSHNFGVLNILKMSDTACFLLTPFFFRPWCRQGPLLDPSLSCQAGHHGWSTRSILVLLLFQLAFSAGKTVLLGINILCCPCNPHNCFHTHCKFPA